MADYWTRRFLARKCQLSARLVEHTVLVGIRAAEHFTLNIFIHQQDRTERKEKSKNDWVHILVEKREALLDGVPFGRIYFPGALCKRTRRIGSQWSDECEQVIPRNALNALPYPTVPRPPCPLTPQVSEILPPDTWVL